MLVRKSIIFLGIILLLLHNVILTLSYCVHTIGFIS